MTTPIATLSCPSCGGRLQIVKGVDRFACGHCGNEHVVHRESGIVYLEPIAHDIRHIRTGVDNLRGGIDKTAAELAIVRLQKEIADLESKRNAIRDRKVDTLTPRSSLEIVVALLALAFFFLLFAVDSSSPMLWVLFWFSLLANLILWIRRDGAMVTKWNKEIKDIETNIDKARATLARNLRLV